VLDIERRELRRDGALCPVEPQVFNLLRFLIENRGRAVSRDEIFQAVWQGRVVSDSVLGTRINAARKAIGDDGRRQRLIQTRNRHGFRFVATVCEDNVAGEPEVPAHPAGTRFSADRGDSPGSDHAIVVRQRKPRLLVLPFINLPSDQTLACISQGIAEDTVTALVRSKSFDVIASDCVCHEADNLKGIASSFGAGYILVCTARRIGDRIRQTVRLMEAGTGLHIWARSYTQTLAAGFDDQDAVTSNVVASIEPHIYAAEENRSSRLPYPALGAAGCVMRALSIAKMRGPQNYASAQEFLAKALELDPACVRAHSLSAWFTGIEVMNGWKSRAHLARALEVACRALLLDDHDPWAHFSMGWALAQNRCPEEAIEEYRKALAINPYFREAYCCLGLALGYLGRIEQALTALDNGEKPGAPEILVGLSDSVRAGIYFCAENPRAAVAAARRSTRLTPGLVPSQRHLVVNSALAGEMDEARAAYATFVRLVPNASLGLIAGGLPNIRDNDLNRTLDAFRLVGLA
jgi:DNA-binding winged helix-turn-helix (wHTH) protein/TolB-like protein/Tfp pilus assembly protein PilF